MALSGDGDILIKREDDEMIDKEATGKRQHVNAFSLLMNSATRNKKQKSKNKSFSLPNTTSDTCAETATSKTDDTGCIETPKRQINVDSCPVECARSLNEEKMSDNFNEQNGEAVPPSFHADDKSSVEKDIPRDKQPIVININFNIKSSLIDDVPEICQQALRGFVEEQLNKNGNNDILVPTITEDKDHTNNVTQIGQVQNNESNSLPVADTCQPLFVFCPVGCGEKCLVTEMNDHLDMCLATNAMEEKSHTDEPQQQQQQQLETYTIQPTNDTRLLFIPSSSDRNRNLNDDKRIDPLNIPSSSGKLEINSVMKGRETHQGEVSAHIDASKCSDGTENERMFPSQYPSTKSGIPATNLHIHDDNYINLPRKLTTGNNAFDILMNSSKLKHTKSIDQEVTKTHRLHLNKDFSVSLYVYENESRSVSRNQQDNENRKGAVTSVRYASDDKRSDDNTSSLWAPADCCWSALTKVAFKHDKTDCAIKKESIQLIVSTSIPSYPTKEQQQQQLQQQRFVSQHSKMSVPVLKSILQKSIRRRKPMPSVRVAMEILDKAAEALFRRLPIIVLEDTTLHPSFSFLIWLMVASSKEYNPSPKLLLKILQTIFEVASCPWHDVSKSDDINNDKIDGEEQQGQHIEPAATSFHNFVLKLHEIFQIHRSYSSNVIASSLVNPGQNPSRPLHHEVPQQYCLVYCMFVRAEYGGMNCDVHMLRQYASTWLRRFGCPSVLAQSQLQGQGINNDMSIGYVSDEINWMKVPWTAHQVAMEQSHDRLGLRMDVDINNIWSCPNTLSLQYLSLQDIAIQGIDFHCSPVLRHVVSENAKSQVDWMDHIKRLYQTNALTGDTIVDSETVADTFLKQCMWDFLSGINYRLPLNRFINKTKVDTNANQQHQQQHQQSEGNGNDCQSNKMRKEIWNKYFAESVRVYQSKYVQDRLVKSSSGQ